MTLKFQRPARLPMPLSVSKGALAIAAVVAIALKCTPRSDPKQDVSKAPRPAIEAARPL
jgi:hypothetical protein